MDSQNIKIKKGQNRQAKEHIEDMHAIALPPLLYSLIKLFSLLGKQISPFKVLGGKKTSLKPAEALKSAKEFGFKGSILYRELNNISVLTLPCILFLKDNNSCILKSIEEKFVNDKIEKTFTIIISSKEEHIIEISYEELDKEYTGYSLFLTKPIKEDKRTKDAGFLHEKLWFWNVILHYLPIYKHVFFASILINIIAIASSLFAMNVYDRVVPNAAIETLWGLAIGLLIAYICDFILKNIRAYFVDTAGRNADVILSSKLIHRILNVRYQDRAESSGVLASNIREFENLREFFSSGTLVAFIDLPFLLLFLFLIWYIGGAIVAIPLIAIPILICFNLIFERYSARHIEENFKQNMQKNALLVEILNGLEAIKCASAERNIQENWESLVGVSALASSSSKTVNSFISIFSSSLTQIVSLCVIIAGVYKIAAGDMTMGALIGANILVGRAMAPLLQISSMLTRLQQSKLTLKALDTLMQVPTENEDIDYQDMSIAESKKIDIAFNNVEFAYNAEPLNPLNEIILKDINISIPYGEKLGIIGKMGSGKSTFARLLAGLYLPTKGSITINKRDMRQLDMRDVRSKIGYLTQDVVLFYGSIRDNIALNDKRVSDKLVLKAAELAGVMDFAQKHPLGLSAQVGERGMQFSGGQRQAIALARALLYKPEILILDEPSSNMDSENEEILKARIQSIIKPSTLILITHRYSMLKLVNRVLVIENNTISIDAPTEQCLDILQNKGA